MVIDALRPKGQLPFVVRRVRSLPVKHHERTEFFVLAGVLSAQPPERTSEWF